MAQVRAGDRMALLIVDAQVGVMREAWEAPRVIANIALAVERARERGVAVLWVQHENEELLQGSPQWQWVPELVPAAGEALVPKRYNSAFEATTLEQHLAELGATHIVLAGAASNWCIRATAYGALDRGYDLTLLGDAHSTESMALDDGSRIEARDIIAELNIAMRWLDYPGRRNAVVNAAEFEFRAP